MELFDNIKNLDYQRQEYINTFIKKIKQFPYVSLWGISESCDEAIKFLRSNNIVIKSIYNVNAEEYNFTYRNIPVVQQSFDEIDTNGAIIVTCSFYNDFRSKLIQKYPNIDDNLFLFDGYFLEDKKVSYFIENKNVIIKCYDSLVDDLSKKSYDALLKYRFIRDSEIIKNLCNPRNDCYLDDVFINNYKSGLYIDAWSYNADFVTFLKNKVDISKSKFYIFEPNNNFYQKIVDNLDKSINYKVYDVALCDREDKMEFVRLPFSTSHIVNKKYNAYNDTMESYIDIVDTKTLDSIVWNEKVTGIKVDIEWAEFSMLVGATNTIKRDRPIILIAIYHRWDDMFQLQNYLMELNLNYKFYIRHYSLSVAKTILYCIPQ